MNGPTHSVNLERLLEEHRSIGSPVGSGLRSALDRQAIARQLAAAHIAATDELVSLYSWHDGEDAGVGLFGDVSFCDLVHSIQITGEQRSMSRLNAGEMSMGLPADGLWPDAWCVIGLGDRVLCVLDSTTHPATVLYVLTHGETSARTMAASLEAYLDQTTELLRTGGLEFDPAQGRIVESPRAMAEGVLAGQTAPPRWLLDGELPAEIPVSVTLPDPRPQFQFQAAVSLHRCRPLRRLVIDPSLAPRCWPGRPPLAFLETLLPGTAETGEPRELQLALTDAGNRPVVGAPIQVTLSGAAELVVACTTDEYGMATCRYVARGPGQLAIRATARHSGAVVYGSQLVSLADVIDAGAPRLNGVSLRPEGASSYRVTAQAVEPIRDWLVRYRLAPDRWVTFASGSQLPPDGNLATIDTRAVWPGLMLVEVAASSESGTAVERRWLSAEGGRAAALLVEAEPPLQFSQREWENLVLVLDRELGPVLGVQPGFAVPSGPLNGEGLVALGYGRILGDG